MLKEINLSQAVFDTFQEAILVCDLTLQITAWNSTAENITGFIQQEVLSQNCYKKIRHVDAYGRPLSSEDHPLLRTIREGKNRSIDTFIQHKNGQVIPVHARTELLHNQQGNVIGAMEVFSQNIFAWTNMEKVDELRWAAYLDPLTGMPNRRYAEIVLLTYLSTLRKHGDLFGVCLVDADRFKLINDHYGHATGDFAIKSLAQMLVSSLRNSDLVARWGGDEFLVLVQNVDDRRLAIVAERMCNNVNLSVLEVGSHTLNLTVSLGATSATEHDTLESIINRADQLMYQSKGLGGNCVTLMPTEFIETQQISI